MCSSDEDVVVSLRLIEKDDPFKIRPKQKDCIPRCAQSENYLNQKRKISKMAINRRCPWFYLWFAVIIWLPVVVLVSFILIDPYLALSTLGMSLFSMYLLVIVLSLFYFRKYDLVAIAQTVWWQELLVLLTFIMGFSVSYTSLVLRGTHFEVDYDFWGTVSIATNSLESSILTFLRNAKRDKAELMRRIVTLYYYLICCFHQSYNVTASINFVETMRWVKRIEPMINDLYKYGEHTFVVEEEPVTLSIEHLDVMALDMVINGDILGIRRMFLRRDVHHDDEHEHSHYHRYATVPVEYVKYIFPSILLLSMCGNVAFQCWFIYQVFQVYVCWAAIIVQALFVSIAVIHVLGKRSWMVNNGWNFRILRYGSVDTLCTYTVTACV